MAKDLLKNSYSFNFLNIDNKANEKELKDNLVSNITNFLLELGKGFAYMGKEYKLEVAGDEFYIDLLFYHTILKCYVVIEVKTKKFKPEYLGQLNFYITAVDKQLKAETDNPSIGLLLCKEKNDLIVEYSLSKIMNPIGVSQFKTKKDDNLSNLLPTKEELKHMSDLMG